MIRDRGFGNDAIAAALLHDLVEYTDTEIDDIYIKFGKVIGDLVKEVTDKNVFVGMTKKEQEDLYLNHLSKASYVGKSIKLASLIDSTKDIIKYDEDFVKFYLPECENLLEVLADGDPIFLKDIKWTFFLSKKRLEKRINK
jgi:(p)ppGpp synthase/HD superfamily hydrolase